MIEKEDIERLKDIFVTRQECNVITGDLETRLMSSATKLTVIETQMKTAIWLAKTTLAAVITAIIGAVMLLILR